MNATYLQTNADADVLIDHMRAHGYSRSYIKKCRRVCNYVITLSNECDNSTAFKQQKGAVRYGHRNY